MRACLPRCLRGCATTSLAAASRAAPSATLRVRASLSRPRDSSRRRESGRERRELLRLRGGSLAGSLLSRCASAPRSLGLATPSRGRETRELLGCVRARLIASRAGGVGSKGEGAWSPSLVRRARGPLLSAPSGGFLGRSRLAWVTLVTQAPCEDALLPRWSPPNPPCRV